MKRWTLLFAVTLAVILAAPVQAARAAPIAPDIAVVVEPRELVPAQAGFVFVGGAYPMDVNITLGDEPLPVYWTGEGYVALFAFDFDEPPGDHRLAISAFNAATGVQFERVETIKVLEFKYPDEYVALSYNLTPLLDPQLNIHEVEQLAAVYERHTRLNGWGWPYAIPAPGSVVTSRFGGNRSYNSGLWQAYHTGTDFRMGIGAPILATASGRVAVARMFDVRGNVVIIDHGFGVFSQYAHMSEIYVTPGQAVQRGQVIGLVGATGRTNGPHLHFEIIVNGIPVDPIRWLALSPDFVPPREIRPEQRASDESAGGDAPLPPEGETPTTPESGETTPPDAQVGS